ncbi:MAG: hypothetical protein EOP04_03635 [Proteobacteria bacterium]|nr:MAG: hypothetical protein EOP04_03635 [Pseudomonadota bacterium]
MKKLFLILIMTVAGAARADDIYVHDGDVSSVTINSSLGTLIEFPQPITVVSDSAQFTIEKVATEVSQDGKAVNIRIVKIRPKRPGAIETVPFILTGRRSMNVRFVSLPDAPKHQKLRYPDRNQQIGGKFLGSEITLMKQMLKDEGGEGFQKSILDKKLSIDGFDTKLSMILVRRWEGQGFFGYVFKIVNKSREAVTLNPQALNFESPNRAVLLQTDHETLEPCSVNASADPTSNSCVTALRLVVRGEHFAVPSSGADLPFRIAGEGL